MKGNRLWKLRKRSYKNELNPAWKEKISYIGIHAWVYRNYGKAFCCTICGGKKGSRKYEWANISGQYKRDINDWTMLCKICHAWFDGVSEGMSIIRTKKKQIDMENKII